MKLIDVIGTAGAMSFGAAMLLDYADFCTASNIFCVAAIACWCLTFTMNIKEKEEYEYTRSDRCKKRSAGRSGTQRCGKRRTA